MKGWRFARPAAGILIVGAWLGAAAAEPRGRADDAPGLRELVRLWGRTDPVPAPSAAGGVTRVEALRALNGGGRLLPRCATPLLLALSQNASRLGASSRLLADLATQPRSGGLTSLHLSPGGEFQIQYTVDPASPDRVDPGDEDLDGVPDGVARIGAELTDLLADLVHDLDWAPSPAPAAAGAPRSGGAVHVVLVDLHAGAGGTRGFVAPFAQGWAAAAPSAPEGSDSVIFLDSGLAAPSASSRQVVAHMLAHVAQMRESVHESPWWDESSATWIETRLTGDAAEAARAFRSPRRPSSRGFDDEDLGLSVEEFLWPHFLARSSGLDAALVRKLWEEMAAVPGDNTFDAFDRVARRLFGSSLADDVRVFNVWNLFLGQADDGRHYPFGSQLDTPQGDLVLDAFPARGASVPGPLRPLGSALIRVLCDGTQGGLRVRFSGGEPGAWDLSAVVTSASDPAGVRLVTVTLDAAGQGHLALPWRSLAVVDLLVQNLAAPPAEAADYAFGIDYDPALPFDLLNFSADDTGAGAALAWSTESEESLAGWNVMRGTSPVGPFVRLNQFLLPGAGSAGLPMEYVYLDATVEPGRKYYYFVEGITLEGFTERTHPAGVRVGRAAAPPGPSR